MACRLLEHMKENHLLDTLQSAYKKAHSTEIALLRVQNDILTSTDQKRGTFLILLDLSAAFDTVDHDLLLSFLENNIELTGYVPSLFRTYLSGWSQWVSVNCVWVLSLSIWSPTRICIRSTYFLHILAYCRIHIAAS